MPLTRLMSSPRRYTRRAAAEAVARVARVLNTIHRFRRYHVTAELRAVRYNQTWSPTVTFAVFCRLRGQVLPII